jgi:hypothetical protein
MDHALALLDLGLDHVDRVDAPGADAVTSLEELEYPPIEAEDAIGAFDFDDVHRPDPSGPSRRARAESRRASPPVPVPAARVELADSALHAPAAGFDDQDFYPDLVDKAAVLVMFIDLNGGVWGALQ